MDYNNIEEFKSYIEGFMKYHNLRGIEMLLPYVQEEPVFRACGKGMVHPEGTSLAGVELWDVLDSMLNDDERVNEL